MEKYQSMWEQLKSETEGIEGTVTVPICWVHARMKMMESFWELCQKRNNEIDKSNDGPDEIPCPNCGHDAVGDKDGYLCLHCNEVVHPKGTGDDR